MTFRSRDRRNLVRRVRSGPHLSQDPCTVATAIKITCTVNSDGGFLKTAVHILHILWSFIIMIISVMIQKQLKLNSTKFTAKLVREDSQRNASALWFKFTQEMNGTTIRCETLQKCSKYPVVPWPDCRVIYMWLRSTLCMHAPQG